MAQRVAWVLSLDAEEQQSGGQPLNPLNEIYARQIIGWGLGMGMGPNVVKLED